MSKTVVVTGGTRGLGREISLAFGRTGYAVVAFYQSNDSAAKELQAMLEAEGITHAVVRHDIREAASEVWNRPEIQDADQLVLVHNACARFSPVAMHRLEWTDFEEAFQVAVKGGWLCAQGLIRPMLAKGGGVIVNVLTSAINGASPKGFAAYSTAKHALRGLTLAQAAEFADRGVKVFSVSPAFMETSLTQGWDSRLRDAIRANAGRITDPAQAAKCLVAMMDNPGIAGRGEDFPI